MLKPLQNCWRCCVGGAEWHQWLEHQLCLHQYPVFLLMVMGHCGLQQAVLLGASLEVRWGQEYAALVQC
jgi:hypothetical protein